MSEHYDFHYQPTGSGAISGQQVLQQTEDAINELGEYVNDNVGGAMDVAQQALETAQNAETNAQTALDTANSFSSAIQSAQQDASTALSTAQTAQNTASNANNTAIQAQQDASSAVTTANNASGQVSTLSGTVTALGQRVTTAEGNIGQNTSDITALTTRVGTAEGNITTLQNDVSIAMGNASSAMATAGTVKQQAFVFRYSSTALVASSTNSNALLDNTDNLKVGDKVIDSSGVLFSITAIDTANSTFTIGTALVDLALDANVVHTNEINSSGIGIIEAVKEVGGVDFNTLTTQGLYGTNASGSTNNPENSPCVVQVIKRLNSVIQIANVSSSAYKSRYIRYCADITAQSPVWQSWIKFAIDSDVVHTSGNETKSGELTLSDTLKSSDIVPLANLTFNLGTPDYKYNNVYAYMYNSIGRYFGNEATSNQRTNITLYANRDTQNQSCAYITRFRQNRAQGALQPTDLQKIGFDVLENEVRTNNVFDIQCTDWLNNVPRKVNIVSNAQSYSYGNSARKALFNDINPGALSMPDLSNGIDISSYITNFGAGTVNEYTPISDGWISIANGSTDSPVFIRVYNDYGFEQIAYSERNEVGGTTGGTYTRFGALMIPCIKNVKIYIIVTPTTSVLVSAKFFPCQGNV